MSIRGMEIEVIQSQRGGVLEESEDGEDSGTTIV